MDLNTGHSLCCHFLVSGRYEITLYRCSSVSAFWDCLRTAAVWNAPTRSSATCWGLVVWISVVDGPYDKFDEQQQSWSTMMTASLVKACQFIVFVGPPHVVFVITHKLGHSDLDQCAILVPSLSTFNFLRVMTCWQEVDGHSVILHHCHALFAMKITVTSILYLLNFHALRYCFLLIVAVPMTKVFCIVSRNWYTIVVSVHDQDVMVLLCVGWSQ